MAIREFEHSEKKNDKAEKIMRRRHLMLQMEEQALAVRRKKNAATKPGTDIQISDPADAHEYQADAVAKKVVSGADASAEMKRDHSSSFANINAKKEEGILMARSEDGSFKGTEKLQNTLDSSKGGGQALDDKTKSEMGEKMGADLSAVKIHTDHKAHQMSEGINAKAFTHGQDIYFKHGNFDTTSHEGKELLAHELTHTVQQKDGVDRKIQRQPDGKTDKDWHAPASLMTGGIIYKEMNMQSALVFKTNQVMECEVWDYSPATGWYYIQLDEDHLIYGYAQQDNIAMHYQLDKINVESVKVLPDSVSQLATFYNVKLGGEPFRVDVTYDVFNHESGLTCYLVFNFNYQGTGFANFTPSKIYLNMSESPFTEMFNEHGGDFQKDTIKKMPPQRSFVLSANDVKKNNKFWENELLAMFSANKANISFGENGILTNKTTSYVSFRINALQLGGSYAKNINMWAIIYDNVTAGEHWTPAEKIHTMTLSAYIDKNAPKITREGNDPFEKQQSSFGSSNADRIKQWLTSRPKSANMPAGLAESKYGEPINQGNNLIIVPDGAIRKDQENDLYSQDRVSIPGEGFGSGGKIKLDTKQELALAIARLEIIKSNDVIKVKKWKLGKVINHLTGLYNSDEQNTSGNAYHSLTADVSTRIDEIMQIVWPGRGTDDDAAIKIQKKSDETIDAYINALYSSIDDVKKGRTLYFAAERKRISLKDRIAAMVVASNSTTDTTFIEAKKVFANIDRVETISFEETHSYMKYGILQSEGYKLSRTREGLFEENKKEDLSPYDYNTEFGYEKAMQSYFEVTMFAQLSQVYFAYEFLHMTLNLESKVWNILQSKDVDKAFLASKFKALGEVMIAINDEFKVDPYGFNNYEKVDFAKVIAQVNKGMAIVSERGFLEKVQYIFTTLQQEYKVQAGIVFVIVLIAAFILTALGGIGLAALGVETASGAGAAGFFFYEVAVFGGTGLMGKKMMGEDINAITIAEELGSALLMVGFLRVAGAGFQRIYKLRAGEVDIEVPKAYTAATTYVSLQAYAELSHLVTEGKFMSGEERVKSLMLNFIVITGFSILSKYTVEPLENAVIRNKVNKYLANDDEIIKAKTNLEALKDVVMPKRNKFIDPKTGKLISAEAPDVELVKQMGELHNLEQLYMEAVSKATDAKNTGDMPPKEKKALKEEVSKLKKQSDDAVRDTELMFAMAGFAMPVSGSLGMEFYPLRPGEIGFKETGKKYLQDRFGKGNFTEAPPGSGVYIAKAKDAPPVIFISEKATEGRMLGGDEKAKEGYELYKKDKKQEGVFETLSSLNKPFEGLKDYFIEYKTRSDYTSKAVGEGLTSKQAEISYEIVSKSPKDAPFQSSNNLDDLYAQAAVAKTELDALTNQLAKETGGGAETRPKDTNGGLKSRDRALEKINGDYKGDASQLIDIAGSKIIYENLNQLYVGLKYIGSKVEIVRIKDRYVKPQESGFRDILINLKMANGHYVELRLTVPEMEAADVPGHLLYEKVRTIEANAKTENRELTLKEKEEINQLNKEAKIIYSKAWENILLKNK